MTGKKTPWQLRPKRPETVSWTEGERDALIADALKRGMAKQVREDATSLSPSMVAKRIRKKS